MPRQLNSCEHREKRLGYLSVGQIFLKSSEQFWRQKVILDHIIGFRIRAVFDDAARGGLAPRQAQGRHNRSPLVAVLPL